jgi:hypothetical protein
MFPPNLTIFPRSGVIKQWAGRRFDDLVPGCYKIYNLQRRCFFGGAVAQLAARLDGIEEVGGSNPPGSTKI